MKRFFTKVMLCAGIIGSQAAFAGNLWQQVSEQAAPVQIRTMSPEKYLVYTLDEATLKLQMWGLAEDPAQAMIVSLPMPDGTYRDFSVWQTPMMPQELANKYPDIKTFTGQAVNDHRVTARLEFTLFGFSAMIYDGDNTSFVDPYDNLHDGFYLVHYKKDETRALSNRMKCQVKGDDETGPAGTGQMETGHTTLPRLAQRTFNGYNLRTYRLALSADHQYAAAATGLASPTVAQTLSKMTVSMNRINGVYNREFSVQMNFCPLEDTLIWNVASAGPNGADPFSAIDANGGACLDSNQQVCTRRVGAANYDLGHVFTTGGGGISQVGVVCNNTRKAESCTGSPTPVGDGYDIDYVAHEMGHEFGSQHTFNDNANGSCGGNAVSSCAYEPASGATIMDYAGICPPDDIQPHSDAYFSASSLVQIQSKLAGSENACAVIASTGNKQVYIAPFTASYTIPYKTPFELIAPTAVDSAADTSTTYCWAQWNLGDFGKTLATTYLKGPIFRSYTPVASPTRVFPQLSWVLAGSFTHVSVENAMGEKAPDTARYLTFRMACRTILNGNGVFVFPDDTVHLDVVQTTTKAGFAVTSQGTTGITYNGGDAATVTWNVVGTDVAPVSATNVVIYMSADGGLTWPDTLGTFPNNGSASVALPNPATTSATCRFKVKGENNVFFNVNLKNFTVSHNPSGGGTHAQNITLANSIQVFPVPATDIIHITSTVGAPLSGSICNAVGQQVWSGTIAHSTDIATGSWARGVYYIRLATAGAGQTVKSIVLE